MPLFAICYLCAHLYLELAKISIRPILKAHHRCGQIAAFFDQAR